MITRRRTYSKQFADRYGYFMRNTSFMQGLINPNQDTQNYITNIYTKCLQKESPVGQFPTSYRTADVATNGNTNDNFKNFNACVGCTDGSTIIVATAKKLYKSTNGGGTWTQLCTWNNETYISAYTGPIVYMDSNYFYILYTSTSTKYESNGYYYLKLFKYRISNGATSRTTLSTIYNTTTYYPFNTTKGEFYADKVSPKGQIVINYNATSSQFSWIMVDIPRGVVSGTITKTSNQAGGSASTRTLWQNNGQWFNDGSTYGKFLIINSDYTTINSEYCRVRQYYTIAASQFSSGASITTTSITSSLGTIVTDNYQYYIGTSNIYAYPQIFIASCEISYKNKLFIVSFTNINNPVFYVCNTSFSQPASLLPPSNWEELAFEDSEFVRRPSGNFVTPDGNNAVYLFPMCSIVWSLIDNSVFGAFLFGKTDRDKVPPATGEYQGFMLPKTTLNS